MNLVDLFLIVVVLFSIYNGWLKGFIVGFLELLMFVAGVVLAFYSYSYIVDFIEKHFPGLGVWTVPLSFIIALVLIRIILSIVVNRLLLEIPASALTSPVNHSLGIIPGAINGFIWATIISALLLLLPFSDGISNNSHNSLL